MWVCVIILRSALGFTWIYYWVCPFLGLPRAGESLAVDVRFQPTEEKFYNVNEPWSKDSAQCQTVDGLQWFILGLSHDILTTWSCIWARISG